MLYSSLQMNQIYKRDLFSKILHSHPRISQIKKIHLVVISTREKESVKKALMFTQQRDLVNMQTSVQICMIVSILALRQMIKMFLKRPRFSFRAMPFPLRTLNLNLVKRIKEKLKMPYLRVTRLKHSKLSKKFQNFKVIQKLIYVQAFSSRR